MNEYFFAGQNNNHGGNKKKKKRPKPSEYLPFLARASDAGDGGVSFVFHGDDDPDEDGDICLFSLRDRSSTGAAAAAEALLPKPQPATTTFLEKKLCSDDSLASLALRYGCTVAELKRVNNILTDQEIHGLRTIKVPIKPYSLLTEEIQNDNDAAAGDGHYENELESSSSSSVVRALSIGSSIFPNDSASFLSAMDEDLERIRLTTSHYKSSLEEVTEELTCKRFHPFTEERKPRNRNIGRFVVIWIIVITIIIPLLIFLCLELQKHSST